MVGQLISTADDFPGVKVYREDGKAGPVFSVAFKNKEQRSLGNQMGWALSTPLAVMAFFAWVFTPALEIEGYRAAVGVGGILFGGFILPSIMFRVAVLGPTRSRHVIELDYGADRLRVLRNGRETVSRPLTRRPNFTVEPHPMAQREAAEKRGQLGPFQKQHCLFGWFGAGGAEKVMLVARWEWPPQDSLFEVRQAILWAMERPGAARAGGEAQPAGQGAPSGMKPPLD